MQAFCLDVSDAQIDDILLQKTCSREGSIYQNVFVILQPQEGVLIALFHNLVSLLGFCMEKHPNLFKIRWV